MTNLFRNAKCCCRCIPYRYKKGDDGGISNELEVLVISSQKGHALMFPKVTLLTLISDNYMYINFKRLFFLWNNIYLIKKKKGSKFNVNFVSPGWLGTR